MLLKVELEFVLPILEVAVFLESSIHHANTDGSQIFRAFRESLSCRVEIKVTIIEQEPLDHRPKRIIDKLNAVVEKLDNFLICVSYQDEVRANQDLEDHYANRPLIPKVAFWTDVAELWHVFCRIWRISDESLLVLNGGEAGGGDVSEHHAFEVCAEADGGGVDASHSKFGLL